MSRLRRIILGLAFGLSPFAIAADVEFRNLNFDEGHTNTVTGPISAQAAPISDLVPGWQAGNGITNYVTAYYRLSASFANLDTGGKVSLAPTEFFVPIIEWGSEYLSDPFQLWLLPELRIGGPDSYKPVYLAQTATVPIGTRQVRLICLGDKLTLSMNGQQIPLQFEILRAGSSGAGNYVLYEVTGDISEFAGQSAEMRYTTVLDGFGYNMIDNIAFVVPEPRPSIMLLLVGGTFCIYSVRRGLGLRKCQTSD